MAVNSITFNGINSLDYGLYVSGDKTFNSAEKDYEKVSVPGRSGDLLIFNNRYKNVNQTYDAILIEDYLENSENVKAWLLSADGYCRLEDTYHPDEYRIASFSGPVDFTTMLLEAGSTTLTFDCKPQRWLKSGDISYFVRSGSISINNPTMFDSKPIVKVNATVSYTLQTAIPEWKLGKYYEKLGEETYIPLVSQPEYWDTTYTNFYTRSGQEGSYVYTPVPASPSDWATNYTDYYTRSGFIGSYVYTPVTGDSAPAWAENTYYKRDAVPCVLSVGGYTVTISDVKGSVTIDSEIEDAYNGTENRNPTITLSNGFPKLSPGQNEISFSGSGVTSVEVIPKWWTL